MVRLAHQHFQALAIEGDVRLGGKDWDDRIVDRVAALFKEQTGIDPRDDAQALVNLGHALMSQGKHEEAQTVWQSAVRSNVELAEQFLV